MKREDEIDDLLAMARAAPRAAPPGLLARVLEDAYEAQPVAAPRPVAGRGGGSWFRALAGGFPALSGLAAATVGGLWIGFALPSSVAAVTEPLGLTEPFAGSGLIPEFDDFLSEG